MTPGQSRLTIRSPTKASHAKIRPSDREFSDLRNLDVRSPGSRSVTRSGSRRSGGRGTVNDAASCAAEEGGAYPRGRALGSVHVVRRELRAARDDGGADAARGVTADRTA